MAEDDGKGGEIVWPLSDGDVTMCRGELGGDVTECSCSALE